MHFKEYDLVKTLFLSYRSFNQIIYKRKSIKENPSKESPS